MTSEAPERIWFLDKLGAYVRDEVYRHEKPGSQEYVRADALAAAQEEIAKLKAEIEAMKNPPEEYCVKCGAPKSNHPFRHQFVARAALGKEG